MPQLLAVIRVSLVSRYMNPVWEHWECESIGGKGDKVDAYMCAVLVLAASCLFLSARLQVLPRCTAAAGRGG